MGPGPRGGRPNEKSKNFGAAMVRILSELRTLLIPTIVAVLFACGGSYLMIVAPNIVSNLVDEISKGLFGQISFEAIKAIAELKVDGPCVPAAADIEYYGEDVFNLEMVSAEAAVAVVLGREAFLELGEKDPSTTSGFRILKTLQH